MNLYDQAIKDAQRFTSDAQGFGVTMTITAPTSETVTFLGLTVKTNLGINTDGVAINSKRAVVSFSEKYLTDAGYPVRAGGNVHIEGHRLDVKDSTGTVCAYVIQQCYPDETIGILTCILEDYIDA